MIGRRQESGNITKWNEDAELRGGPYLLEKVGVCNLLAGAAPAHLEAQQMRGKGGRQVEAQAVEEEEEHKTVPAPEWMIIRILLGKMQLMALSAQLAQEGWVATGT